MNPEMTPKERMGAFLTGKPVDRIPVVPLILNHAARVTGATISEHATDGEVMGRAHIAAYRRYGQDLITLFSDTCITGEALGSELFFPPDDVPRMKTPAVVDPSDLDRLPKVDVRDAGRLGVYFDAVRICVDELGDEVFVSCCIPAPFSTAASLRGTATLARDLYKNPGLAEALLEKSLEIGNDTAEAIVEAGGIPVLVDPVASGSVLSRAMFERFALPYIRRAFEKIVALGSVPILHICGRTANIVDLMAVSGAVALSIDEISVAKAAELTGGAVCIMGNVRPAETLLGGTPEDVLAEASQCMAEGADNTGGFILASGCEVPIDAPAENIDALINAARKRAE